MDLRGNGQDLILQAFHWNLVKSQGTGTMDGRKESWYVILTSMAYRIASLGFTVVYLPPPWRDDSEWYSNGRSGGGEGYFWHDFDLNSRYGTKEELKALVNVLHKKNIKVIVDIVINHRDGARMKNDIWEYPGSNWMSPGPDLNGSFMDGKYNLRLSNSDVSKRVHDAIDELTNDCGIDGWRWDFIWNYEIAELISWIRSANKLGYLSIGEFWQNFPNMKNEIMAKRYESSEAKHVSGWNYESDGPAFDIVLKSQIQSVDPRNFKYGLNLSSNINERRSAVTFVDNHEMGASPYSPANGWGQQSWPCPPAFKSKAYAFILTSPGIPCVYWPDCFDWGLEHEISELIKLRKRAGIVADSGWKDLTDSYTGFAAIILNSRGEDALAVSIGSNFLEPGEGWEIGAKRSDEWIVWIKSL